MKIEFKNMGVHIGTRTTGAAIREKILSCFENTDKVILDFSEVESVSNSFADECFAKLIDAYDFREIKTKMIIENASSAIRDVIGNAFHERLAIMA